MAIWIGMGVGLMYGSLFAGVMGTLLPAISRARPTLLPRLVDRARFVVMATAVLYVGILYWGIIGALLAGVYLLAESLAPGGGLGSPNLVYSLGIAVLAAVVAGPSLIFARQGRIHAGILASAFIVGFGWLVPLLAA